MSEKHDKSYARTAQDIERKYQFGKTFAEMLGLINDNRDKVDEVESSLRDEITNQVTTLRRDTSEIYMSAEETVKLVSENANEVNAAIKDLTDKVEFKMDAHKVNIAIQNSLANGVTTKTGYTFNDEGLNISKSGEEMSNRIDYKGMVVKRNTGENILVANNTGVEATNLHAKTYLIVGEGDGRSRFEDYGINRTGCFWIGG